MSNFKRSKIKFPVWKQNLAQSYKLPTQQSKSTFDLILQRIAHGSQFALIVLGLIGYFYTVRPAYQYERLQEKTAKLEHESEAARHELDLIQAQLQAKSDILDTAIRSLVMVNYKTSYSFNVHDALMSITEQINPFANEDGLFILDYKDLWPDFYSMSTDAVFKTREITLRQTKIEQPYFDQLTNFLSTNKAEIECPPPNFTKLHSDYLLEKTKIDDNLYSLMEEHFSEIYAVQPLPHGLTIQQSITLVEEPLRKIVRAKNIFSLQASYRDKLSDIYLDCHDRSESFNQKMTRSFLKR